MASPANGAGQMPASIFNMGGEPPPAEPAVDCRFASARAQGGVEAAPGPAQDSRFATARDTLRSAAAAEAARENYDERLYSLARHGHIEDIERILDAGMHVDAVDEAVDQAMQIGCRHASPSTTALRYRARRRDPPRSPLQSRPTPLILWATSLVALSSMREAPSTQSGCVSVVALTKGSSAGASVLLQVSAERYRSFSAFGFTGLDVSVFFSAATAP